MHPVLAFIGVTAGTFTPPTVLPGGGIDHDARVRAFHDAALFAAGGGSDIDLVPVQAMDGSRFLISQALSEPDAHLDTGAGWMAIRDTRGTGVGVVMTDSTTLYDLVDALNEAHTDVVATVAEDDVGWRLLVAVDPAGAVAMTAPIVEYLPAESAMSGTVARFTRSNELLFPIGSMVEFEAAGYVQLDDRALWSSFEGGVLDLDTAAPPPGAPGAGSPAPSSGWALFDDMGEINRAVGDHVWSVEQTMHIGAERAAVLDYSDARGSWAMPRMQWMAPNRHGELYPVPTSLLRAESAGFLQEGALDWME